MGDALVVYSNETGLSMYAQFDDDVNDSTRLLMTEGVNDFLRRYLLTEAEMVSATVPAGTYTPSIRVGDPEYPTDDDEIIASFDIAWDGSQIVSEEFDESGILQAIENLETEMLNQFEYVSVDFDDSAILAAIAASQIVVVAAIDALEVEMLNQFEYISVDFDDQAILDAIALSESNVISAVNSSEADVIAAIDGIDEGLAEEVIAGIVDQLEYLTIDVASGGGTIHGRIAYSSLTPDEFLQIVQGEEKIITFIVEATGRFVVQVCDSIVVKIADPAGTVIEIGEDNGGIERLTQEFDVQVLRCTISPEQTASLVAGLLVIEISFDDQKARMTHALKLIEQITEE